MVLRCKVLLSALMVIFSIMSFASPALAADVLKLNVPTPRQLDVHWCWAAASAGIIKFRTGRTVTQCQLKKVAEGWEECPDGSASPTEIMSALEYFNVPSVRINNPTLAQIKYALNHKAPIMAVIAWKTGSAHAIIVDGYNGSILNVDYITQARTYQIKMPYSDLVETSSAKTYYDPIYPRIRPVINAHTFPYMIVGGLTAVPQT